MNRPNLCTWFEIPVADLDRAITFYESVLEVKVDKQDGEKETAWLPMSNDQYGAGGALTKGEDFKPCTDGSLIYLGVAELDSAIERATSGGGAVLSGQQDIGEHGWIAIIKDSEGNRIGLHQGKNG